MSIYLIKNIKKSLRKIQKFPSFLLLYVGGRDYNRSIPKRKATMKKFRVMAQYEYEAEEIIAKDEDEAYTIFLNNLNDYYVSMEAYECEEIAEVCEHCEQDIDECECEDEDEDN